MNRTKRVCVISMLLAMAIVLNIVESFIPVYIPGVKLGLANIVILIMLYEFQPGEALAVDLLLDWFSGSIERKSFFSNLYDVS